MSLGQPQRLWQSSSHRADFLSGSQALFPACLLTVFSPWHPAPQLRLYTARCQSFQNKGGSIFGASFGYTAVCTCPGHHHNCLDHAPLPVLMAWIVCSLAGTSVPPSLPAVWGTHCSELTSHLIHLPLSGLHGKPFLYGLLLAIFLGGGGMGDIQQTYNRHSF